MGIDKNYYDNKNMISAGLYSATISVAFALKVSNVLTCFCSVE